MVKMLNMDMLSLGFNKGDEEEMDEMY